MKKLILLSVMSVLTMSFLTSCDNKNPNNANDSDMDTIVPMVDETEDTLTTSDMNAKPELENTNLVATGTYTGTAKQVDTAEKEIYVETADGKTLENQGDVTDYILNEAKLAVVPFYAFGASRGSTWYRLSVGTCKKEEISEMITMLGKALRRTR